MSACEQRKHHEPAHMAKSMHGSKISIGLLSIFNSMHNTAIDRRWVRLHSKTPLAKNP